MPSSDDGRRLDEAGPLDPDDVGTVMAIHQATFHKLAANRHLNGHLAEFLEDIAATYQRLSERLRRTGPRP